MLANSWFDGFSGGSEERRGHLAAVDCALPGAEAVVLRNLSRHGFIIEAPSTVRVGTIHSVQFGFAQTRMRVSARAIESQYRPSPGGGRGTYRVGFEFRQASRDTRLERFLDAVLAGVTPPPDRKEARA